LPVVISEAPADPEVVLRAEALFGAGVAIVLCRGGRNSRVYRIEHAGETYALKFYPDDGRRRTEREFGAVSFFAAAGMRRVPHPVTADFAHSVAAYTWLDGDPVTQPDRADIDSLASFAADLHALRDRPSAAVFDEGVEACFDASAIVRQIDARVERLGQISREPQLEEFLREHFLPVFARERARVRRFDATPSQVQRTLSPSDFGFHNALRMGTGELGFLDFEYFGWDDPVKLVSDVCWHPGMDLQTGLREQFVARCIDVYRSDSTFERRLLACYSLYGLRWCLIVLNEFVPALWQRRVAAGLDRPAHRVKRIQLQKAYSLLKRVVPLLEGTSL